MHMGVNFSSVLPVPLMEIYIGWSLNYFEEYTCTASKVKHRLIVVTDN